jgi:hypothetical protein
MGSHILKLLLILLYFISPPFVIIALNPWTALALLALFMLCVVKRAKSRGRSVVWAILRWVLILCPIGLIGYCSMVWGITMMQPSQFDFPPNLLVNLVVSLGAAAFPWITLTLWTCFVITVVLRAKSPLSENDEYSALQPSDTRQDSRNRIAAICASVAVGASTMLMCIYFTFSPDSDFAIFSVFFLLIIPFIAGLLEGLLLRARNLVAYLATGAFVGLLATAGDLFVHKDSGLRSASLEWFVVFIDVLLPIASVVLGALFGHWVRRHVLELAHNLHRRVNN